MEFMIISSIVVAVLVTIIFRNTKPIGKFLLAVDTLGLAVAAISGAQIAIAYKAAWFAAIVLGIVTAVAGGLLRDLLCQLEPVVLHRETLATSSLVGTSLYVALVHTNINTSVAALIGGLTVMAVRLLSIAFDLHLPKLKK